MRYDVAVVVLCDDCFGGEAGQQRAEAMSGNEKLGSHHLVAQLYGLFNQCLQWLHFQQSAFALIFRVHQVYACIVLAAKVLLQHSIVEQHLNIVALNVSATMFVVEVALNKNVFTRLLFYQ